MTIGLWYGCSILLRTLFGPLGSEHVLHLHEAGQICPFHLCELHGDILDGVDYVGDEYILERVDPPAGLLDLFGKENGSLLELRELEKGLQHLTVLSNAPVHEHRAPGIAVIEGVTDDLHLEFRDLEVHDLLGPGLHIRVRTWHGEEAFYTGTAHNTLGKGEALIHGLNIPVSLYTEFLCVLNNFQEVPYELVLLVLEKLVALLGKHEPLLQPLQLLPRGVDSKNHETLSDIGDT